MFYGYTAKSWLEPSTHWRLWRSCRVSRLFGFVVSRFLTAFSTMQHASCSSCLIAASVGVSGVLLDSLLFRVLQRWTFWWKCLRNTKNACGDVTTCRGFHTDDGWCRMTVVRTDIFWCTCCVNIPWRFGSWRTSVCFGVRCSVKPVVEIWRGLQFAILLKAFVGDVKGVLLGSGAISLCPSS